METLKKGVYVNTFLLVRNGQNKRMSNSFKSMLTIFELMFGKEFWNHVVIDLSHIEYDDKKLEKILQDWEKAIKQNFPKAADAALSTVVLNSDDIRDQRFEKNVTKLWELSSSMEKFMCKDFETVQTEMDHLKSEFRDFQEDAQNKLQQLEQRAKQEKAQLKKENVRELRAQKRAADRKKEKLIAIAIVVVIIVIILFERSSNNDANLKSKGE